MALQVSVPAISNISGDIIRDVEDLNSRFPELWQDKWVASFIESQQSGDWELRLTSNDGTRQRCTISGAGGQQNSRYVCASLLELRSKWNT